MDPTDDETRDAQPPGELDEQEDKSVTHDGRRRPRLQLSKECPCRSTL